MNTKQQAWIHGARTPKASTSKSGVTKGDKGKARVRMSAPEERGRVTP